MPVGLKWKGDELFLGKTKMADLEERPTRGGWVYVLGPEDFVSEGYERMQDARNDCTSHVQRLLDKATSHAHD